MDHVPTTVPQPEDSLVPSMWEVKPYSIIFKAGWVSKPPPQKALHTISDDPDPMMPSSNCYIGKYTTVTLFHRYNTRICCLQGLDNMQNYLDSIYPYNSDASKTVTTVRLSGEYWVVVDNEIGNFTFCLLLMNKYTCPDTGKKYSTDTS